MKKDQPMRVTLDLPDWIVAALMDIKGPPEIVGESLEDRAYFVLDDYASHVVDSARRRQEREKSRELRGRLGFDVVEDDEIDL